MVGPSNEMMARQIIEVKGKQWYNQHKNDQEPKWDKLNIKCFHYNKYRHYRSECHANLQTEKLNFVEK